MNKRLRDGRPVLLLAGLLLALTPIRLCAADLFCQDSPLMPAGAAAFLTVRPAALADKMGVKEPAKSLPWLAEWKHKVGLPLTSLERCTVVFASQNNYCWILQTLKPYHRQTVLKAWVGEEKLVKHHGKICHVGPARPSGCPAVHFIDRQRLIVADHEETVAWWLKQQTVRPNDAPSLAAWRLADKHDLVAWTRTLPMGSSPAVPAVPTARTGWPGRALASVSRKVCVAPPVGDTAPTLTSPLLMMPLPFALESATMTLDIGEHVRINAVLTCRDAEAAVKGSKDLRALRDLIRGELLAGAAIGPLSKNAEKPIPRLPVTLLRKTGKAMASVRIRPEGKTIPLSGQIDIEAKKLRSELIVCGKLLEGQTAVCPPPTEEVAAPTVIPPGVVAPPPPPPATLFPPPPPAPTVVPSVLTVANVTKDSALLFTMTDGGKLIFAKEVPAGDAMDFETTTGQRWVAVFKSARPRRWTAAGQPRPPCPGPVQQAGSLSSLPTRLAEESSSQPVGETFTPARTKDIWLLR